jgi:hypothetical protein
MKKSFWVLIGVMLVIGVVFMGCDNDGTPNTETAKIIKVNGIDAISGRKSIAVWVLPSLPETIDSENQPQITAIGWGTISSNTLYIDLKVPMRIEGKYNTFSNTNWTGTGDYYVALIPISTLDGTNDWTGSENFNYWFDDQHIQVYFGGNGKVSINTTPIELDFGDFVSADHL